MLHCGFEQVCGVMMINTEPDVRDGFRHEGVHEDTETAYAA